MTTKYVFDLKDDDVYLCTADVGWVTGHSYVVYGPLVGRRHGAHVRGGAQPPRSPTASGTHRPARRHHPLHGAHRHPRVHALGRRLREAPPACARCACSAPSASPSIPRRGCGTTRSIGKKRCPIVDTWWQTETGAIMVTPLPGVTPTKPGSCTLPFFGVVPEGARRERARTSRAAAAAGSSSRSPGPRCCGRSGATTSASRSSTGASCRAIISPATARGFDKDGYLWVVGRIDDVLNVSGHRIGTAEVESALVSHPCRRRGRRRRAARRTEGPGARVLRHAQERRRSPPTSSRR